MKLFGIVPKQRYVIVFAVIIITKKYNFMLYL